MKGAFFDVDGTLTDDRVWRGIMDYFAVHNLRRWTHRWFLAIHYPQYLLRTARLMPEGKFRANWSSHLAWYVRGYSVEEGEQVWAWVVDHFLSQHWRKDTLALLQQHQNAGDVVVLVSSGPEPLLTHIAASLGVQHYVGTRFELQEGRYTGRHTGEVCIDERKASMAQRYLRDQGFQLDLAESSAYADSVADLPLLKMVGRPVATYPSPALLAEATRLQWQVFPT